MALNTQGKEALFIKQLHKYLVKIAKSKLNTLFESEAFV